MSRHREECTASRLVVATRRPPDLAAVEPLDDREVQQAGQRRREGAMHRVVQRDDLQPSRPRPCQLQAQSSVFAWRTATRGMGVNRPRSSRSHSRSHNHSASSTQRQQQAAIGKHAPRPRCTRRRAAETSRGTSAARTSPCPAAARQSHSPSPVTQQRLFLSRFQDQGQVQQTTRRPQQERSPPFLSDPQKERS